jgi:hypothetical protein
MTCLGYTTCIIICKFLKSIKIYLLQFVHKFNPQTLTYAGGCVVCGWFTSWWLRITIQIESCGSSIFFTRFLRRWSITSKCWRIARTSTHWEAVKGRMWIWCSTIGGHMTSPSCLSRSRDCMTLPNTIRTWGGIIREEWLQYGTEWTLKSTSVGHYRIPRSLWMSCPMYHIHTKMPEWLAFNQTIYS